MKTNKKNHSKILNRLLTGTLLFMFLPILSITSLSLERKPELVDLSLKNLKGSKYWSYSNDILSIKNNANVKIIGEKDTCRIIVDKKASATIILKDVSINSKSCPLFLSADTDVTLILEGKNTLKSGKDYAGITQSADAKQLTITGNGSLDVTGGDGSAGIGTGRITSNNINIKGNITIAGNAKVIATGGDRGAGIGVGHNSVSDIVVNIGYTGIIEIKENATVKATGKEGAAGIGGTQQGSIGDINISGNAKVEAIGGNNGAGIGGGRQGSGKNINISGKTQIIALGNGGGAGIGGGNQGSVDSIDIKGDAEIKATGGENGGAGIGGGRQGSYKNINISGGKIEAIGGSSAANIGSGNQGFSGLLNISDKPVIATHDNDVKVKDTDSFTITSMKIKTPDGKEAIKNSNGTITLKNGGIIELLNNTKITVFDKTIIDVDGTITIEGNITIKSNSGTIIQINSSSGSTIIKGDGTITQLNNDAECIITHEDGTITTINVGK